MTLPEKSTACFPTNHWQTAGLSCLHTGFHGRKVLLGVGYLVIGIIITQSPLLQWSVEVYTPSRSSIHNRSTITCQFFTFVVLRSIVFIGLSAHDLRVHYSLNANKHLTFLICQIIEVVDLSNKALSPLLERMLHLVLLFWMPFSSFASKVAGMPANTW